MPTLEGCDCHVAVQLKPRSAGTPMAVSDRQDTWLPLYRARSGHVHGSGGRRPNLANLCGLPACNQSASSLMAKIIPCIFRIMGSDRRLPFLFGPSGP